MIVVLDTKKAVDKLTRALKAKGIDYTVSYEVLPYWHYANLKLPSNAPHSMSLTQKVACYIVSYSQEKEV